MTPAMRAVLEDQLRATGLPEDAVRRMLYAADPVRPDGEACALCGIDLATRPVLSTTRARRSDGSFVNKRVHMKPVQVVATFRVEFSQGLTPELNQRLSGGLWRFCAKCALPMSGTPPAPVAPNDTSGSS